jgi:hypothetical protein
MNIYDLEHVCTTHPRMSKAQWQGIYRQAWDAYYSMEHLERLMRRAASVGRNPKRIMEIALQFYGCFKFEGVHPLQGGFIRRKVRTERRLDEAMRRPVEPAPATAPSRDPTADLDVPEPALETALASPTARAARPRVRAGLS